MSAECPCGIARQDCTYHRADEGPQVPETDATIANDAAITKGAKQ